MQPSDPHPFLRPPRLNTYTAYSIGCLLAWAVVWVVVALTAPRHKVGYIAAFFGGWVLAWVSATIARVVYPPPKPRSSAGPRSFFQGFRPN